MIERWGYLGILVLWGVGRQVGCLISGCHTKAHFFLDGALGYGLWLSPSHCWCLAGSWGIFGGLQGMYHYPEHLCCKCFEALQHHFQKSVSSFICSKIGKLGPFGSFVFFVWGTLSVQLRWIVIGLYYCNSFINKAIESTVVCFHVRTHKLPIKHNLLF